MSENSTRLVRLLLCVVGFVAIATVAQLVAPMLSFVLIVGDAVALRVLRANPHGGTVGEIIAVLAVSFLVNVFLYLLIAGFVWLFFGRRTPRKLIQP